MSPSIYPDGSSGRCCSTPPGPRGLHRHRDVSILVL